MLASIQEQIRTTTKPQAEQEVFQCPNCQRKYKNFQQLLDHAVQKCCSNNIHLLW